MPILNSTPFTPPWYQFNCHLQTLGPSLFRKVKGVTYQRERIETDDHDFLDLDWIRQDKDQLVVLTHGLEGSTDRPYVMGMAKYFSERDWDVLAWNCRSCSGEMNRLPRFYHHGDTEDLRHVVRYAVQKGYKSIALIGFSMGGSMTLRLIAEGEEEIKHIKSAVAISTPVSLRSSVNALSVRPNGIYRKRFIKKLGEKIKQKAAYMPEISHEGYEKITTFEAFDNRYTAPMYGFANADDFYDKASCGPLLNQIKTPALLINALNDPFLGEDCYPKALAENHPFLHLEMPQNGGHVGFSQINKEHSWAEERAFEFMKGY